MTTTAPRSPAAPDLTVRPDELTTRLSYAEGVLATRIAPLLGALETLQYVIAVEMLARLGQASLSSPPKPYREFHQNLHSGSYAAEPAGRPLPGSLPRTASALFLHTRLPKVYTAAPWWFGSIARDVLGGEDACADLLRAARQEGLTFAPEGPPRPLTAAELGPDVGLHEVEKRLRGCPGWALVRTAALLPAVLGLPALRRRWHRRPQEGPEVASAMDLQAAKVERLLAAAEGALPAATETAVQRQRACHALLSGIVMPHRQLLPKLAEAVEDTPPAADFAGLPRVMGLFMVAVPTLALPVRIRDEVTTHPRPDEMAIEHWRDRAFVEGLSPEWTLVCLQRALTSPDS
ncbi:hypothetical protein [Streptomyces sp. NPDC047928]|uniref:hypothetical protein n=1 Tax=unclassified Streptomyces TaxID=2593676 RepID=UPI003722B0F1